MMSMLKSVGGDLVGTSDNCTPIRRDDLQAAGDLLSFILPHEKPWILLKSKVKEFIFTDLAFIQLERDNVGGTRRIVKRYDYVDHVVDHVVLATAGVTTLSSDLRFHIGQHAIEIDIVKEELETTKLYYQTLIALSNRQKRHRQIYGAAQATLNKVIANDPNVLTQVVHVTEALVNSHDPESYGDVFEKMLSARN